MSGARALRLLALVRHGPALRGRASFGLKAMSKTIYFIHHTTLQRLLRIVAEHEGIDIRRRDAKCKLTDAFYVHDVLSGKRVQIAKYQQTDNLLVYKAWEEWMRQVHDEYLTATNVVLERNKMGNLVFTVLGKNQYWGEEVNIEEVPFWEHDLRGKLHERSKQQACVGR